MSESSSALATLVGRMPDPDGQQMYCTNIDKDKIEAAIAEIHKGGREYILGVINMLVEPGKGDDAKAHYALHCLGLYACKLGEAARRQFAEALASQLGTDRPKAVQSYLVQELQAVGRREVAGALGKLLADQDLCEPAARALVAIVARAGEQLRDALQKTEGKCRLAVVQNLGVVRDAKSVSLLKEELTDEKREMRLAAAWALANIGDAGSVDAVLKAGEAQDAYERIKATQACLLLAERLLAAGRNSEAAKIYTHLRDTRTDKSERYVREAAEKALAAAR